MPLFPVVSFVPWQMIPLCLFTNAGMNQFKTCSWAVNSVTTLAPQFAETVVCARRRKHNGSENVRLHGLATIRFSEMLGQTSVFGDYFKRNAINFAWNF